ncbi:EAL domain-containing protein [Niveibacterium umoris]|uniref:EAL and modified HD-GYP domain-containing signal transduction protein n=1 Tax=Niveibacterium umoris TaxID=1193620 RepID=A0A840BHE7_9RHOO|nr:EAL domain-containing protein [Niveibacterium umoris]MBB4011039.1 EAL and modified HD-GYP domain-containing signal transduction protein [Niveibacterium umoris]
MTAQNTAFLGRQPILDRDRKLVGFELLFRGGKENMASVMDDTVATATVVTRAFTDLGIDAALGSGLGFINCDANFLLSDAIEVLPCNRIVLEILETVEPTPEVLDRCRALREKGFMLALDDYIGAEDQFREFLKLVDFIKVDIKPLSTSDIRTLAERLAPLGVPLLAEKVDSQEQADLCHELGFELFQGYFFARPTVLEKRKLNQSEMTLMRLLSLVIEDAETDALENVVKADPSLAVNLLRLVNSVGAGLRNPVHSLRHAITALGRRQLQRWVQLLMFARSGSEGPANPLMIMAATRGRLMELLAELPDGPLRAVRDEAFLAGIVSMMPALLATPIEEILGSLPVSDTLRAALIDRGGPLGALLHLAETLEDADQQAFFDALEKCPGLDPAAVFGAESSAMAWAAQIGTPAQE